MLLPENERQQKQGRDVVVRADAAFAKPDIYEALEKRGVKYAIRIPSNDILEREVAELLTRSVGRPSHKPMFRYKSASWKIRAPGGGEDRVSLWRTVPSGGVHRDDPGDGQPGSGAILQ